MSFIIVPKQTITMANVIESAFSYAQVLFLNVHVMLDLNTEDTL